MKRNSIVKKGCLVLSFSFLVMVSFTNLALAAESLELNNKDTTIASAMEPSKDMLTHIKTLVVGALPKGMEFTRDGKFLFIALLGEPAVVLLDGEKIEIIKKIQPQDKMYTKGEFVEVGVAPLEDAVLVSQMSTGSVHKIPLTGDKAFEITESVSAKGTWSKVIAFSSDSKSFAVSNWTSHDVTLFAYPEMTYIKKIAVPGIPRGLVFADEDKILYTANFSNGALHRIDVEQGKVVETIPTQGKNAALRHLVIDKERNLLYASDMGLECINIYDLTEKKLAKQIRVDYNPNTIALSPDNKYLFVSCRGPNAKASYLNRSPRSGYLYMIDCEKQEVIAKRKLGNQPTALAVHPSGVYVVVSNFRDKNIEVFQIGEPLVLE